MIEPKKYRKKPVVIEAWRWVPEDFEALDQRQWPKWMRDKNIAASLGLQLIIPTLEGPMTASPGDWIVKGIKGEIYPVKPDIFEATYDLVD